MAVEQDSLSSSHHRTDGFYTDCVTYADLNGFSRVVVFEQPVDVYDHGALREQYQILFVETLHTDHWVDVSALQPTDAAAEDGWRVYYESREVGETTPEDEQQGQVLTLSQTNRWFSLQAKGVSTVGVYFPAELRQDEASLAELVKAVDTYFVSTGGMVGIPRDRDVSIHPEEVVNAWSGLPECGVDFLLYDPGLARINGMSLNREDPIYKPRKDVTADAAEAVVLAATG